MLESMEASALATWIRESPSIFAFTLVLILHAIGLGMVVGLNTLIAVRVLGFAPLLPLGALRGLWVPIWIAFIMNAVSGLGLFIAEATKMGTMNIFWVKMGFVLAGMAISLYMKKRYLDDAVAMSASTAPPSARPIAWAMLACWLLALISGRLTGYPELVNIWFGI
ncbi:MAG: hypothetical protein QM696_11780 [Steroidobacteraceae bacterium]